MALKIVRAADPIKVERLNVCLYAPPGVGRLPSPSRRKPRFCWTSTKAHTAQPTARIACG